MRLYLDDDSASAVLAKRLGNAGHDVQLPKDVGLSGADDAVHLSYALRENRLCLSRNHRHFENLHNLIMLAHGHHPGIVVVRQDNDPTRDLTPAGIVRAIGKIEAAGLALLDQYIILNHWR